MTKLRLAVVGAGIMGANHARVARQLNEIELVAVVDRDSERAQTAAGVGGRFCTDVAEILDEIDAAVVAVPTQHHHSVAQTLIGAGKHVLVEKPLALTVAEASEIVVAAVAAGVVLAVGHIERFNAAVAELPKWVEDPVHIRTERISPYSPRILDGVVLDLMIHDLDIVLSLAGGAKAIHVSGVGQHAISDSEDLASAIVRFDNGLTASFTTSRLGQQKIRQVEVTQRDSVVVADLLRQDITVHRMSRHEYLSDEGARYRQSSMIEIPFLETRGEPLALELAHFAECVLTGATPRVDGEAGLRALALAHKVSAALSRSTKPEHAL
jgi:predicted dehydrogenase